MNYLILGNFLTLITDMYSEIGGEKKKLNLNLVFPLGVRVGDAMLNQHLFDIL